MLITFYVQHTGVLKTTRTQFALALLSLIPMLLLGIVPILTGKINFANFFPLIPQGTTSWFSTESFTLMMGGMFIATWITYSAEAVVCYVSRDVLVAGVRLAREITKQSALQPWIEQELAPGIEVQSDAQLGEYVRRSSNTVYYPAGTTYRIGSDDNLMAVVDSNLRVRGVSNLRVADTSVFPTMIGVNPCITCMMVGEKCADLVKQSQR